MTEQAATASKQETLGALQKILMTEFGFDEERLQPGALLVDDLELDSIDAIDLAMQLEEETGLELSEDDLGEVKTIQDVVDAMHGEFAREGG